MKLGDIFKQLRPSLTSVRDRIASIDAEVARLTEDRRAVLTPPLPFDDFAAMMVERLRFEIEYGRGLLARHFTDGAGGTGAHQYMRPIPETWPLDEPGQAEEFFQGDRSLGAFNPIGPAASPAVSSGMLFLVLGEAGIEGFERALGSAMRAKWPRDVGLPRAERLARARELTGQIQRLAAERDELVREIAETADLLKAASPAD